MTYTADAPPSSDENPMTVSASRPEAVVLALTAALEARDEYTGRHSSATSALAEQVGRRLGVTPGELELIRRVAILHDIGKLGIPTDVLRKPGPLDPTERRLMRQHPVIGERILRGIPEFAAVATAIRCEHERWDGGGYPDGLVGEQIPLASRIVFACDAWHAMTSDRPYRRAMHREAALAELRSCAGSQFDPRVTAVLLDLLGATAPPAPHGPDHVLRPNLVASPSSPTSATFRSSRTSTTVSRRWLIASSS